METKEEIKETLISIKEAIENEGVSYGEIHYLQTHKQDVLDFGDITLAQYADITEEQWNNNSLYDKQQVLEDLLKLNSTVKSRQKITIGGEEYTITGVDKFETVYDYTDEYNGDLNKFLKSIVHSCDLDFLSEAGIYVRQNQTSDEYSEGEFISFIDLVTKYKGYVTVSEYKDILEV